MTSSWCRAYQVCSKSNCSNWIWQDKIQSGNRCRKCGTWWTITKSNGKGKGQGHASKGNGASTTSIWPRKTCQEALIDTPPQEVQAVVTRLTAPIPQTEKEIAQQLKQQVTEMKNQSIRKNQLQAKLDQVKSQYAAMLQDMQDIQTKLNEGQQKLKAAVNQTPKPEELNHEAATAEPIPMAVESCYELRHLSD